MLFITLFTQLYALNVTSKIGYLCKETLKKTDVFKENIPKNVELKEIYSTHTTNKPLFGCCRESEIVFFLMNDIDAENLCLWYTLVVNPAPSIYSDKVSSINYDFRTEEGITSFKKPITILDYTSDIFGNLVNTKNIHLVKHFVKEKLRKVANKYQNLSTKDFNVLLERVIRGVNYEKMSLVFFDDIEQLKMVIVNFLSNIELEMNTVDLITKTYDDINTTYIKKLMKIFNEKDGRIIEKSFDESFISKTYHYRNLYKMVIEFDYILMQVMKISGLKIDGNVYDPNDRLSDNDIKCMKCLVLFLEYETEHTISIYLLDDSLKRIKCCLTDKPVKKVIYIPQSEFNEQIKYISVVSNEENKSECLLDITKEIPDLLDRYTILAT
ncbi:hypothetical protein NGRA_2253 [Nosema granulosis]|uniref:Uncharacterized protein n=1 Tax=Nosema granulosis TaxID=83296 RepID=A0A9P6GXW3_9MICR|nr:hypothetical protein NGRA_2253 [Nosema granulosis]